MVQVPSHGIVLSTVGHATADSVNDCSLGYYCPSVVSDIVENSSTNCWSQIIVLSSYLFDRSSTNELCCYCQKNATKLTKWIWTFSRCLHTVSTFLNHCGGQLQWRLMKSNKIECSWKVSQKIPKSVELLWLNWLQSLSQWHFTLASHLC